MSQILHELQEKIGKVKKLNSVVRIMKNLSAAQVIPYRQAVKSMNDYDRMVRLGFRACLEASEEIHEHLETQRMEAANTGVIVFGSDRGMAGQFNEIITEFALEEIKKYTGEKYIWGIGERVHAKLKMNFNNLPMLLNLPNSVEGMADFVGALAEQVELAREKQGVGKLYVIYNKLVSEWSYQPIAAKVLPLEAGRIYLEEKNKWPTKQVPEVIGGKLNTFIHLLREYIFVSFYKACAESIASENASRLAAMIEAEKNIKKLIISLQKQYFQDRQKNIDDELFDIISGFESTK